MTPNYIAKKSIVATLNLWLILLIFITLAVVAIFDIWFLIPLVFIPLGIQTLLILKAICYRIEFHDERIVVKYGIINKYERQYVFVGVYSFSSYQNLWGDIFDYANIKVECPGNWRIDTKGIKTPALLKRFLETQITSENMTDIFRH